MSNPLENVWWQQLETGETCVDTANADQLWTNGYNGHDGETIPRLGAYKVCGPSPSPAQPEIMRISTRTGVQRAKSIICSFEGEGPQPCKLPTWVDGQYYVAGAGGGWTWTTSRIWDAWELDCKTVGKILAPRWRHVGANKMPQHAKCFWKRMLSATPRYQNFEKRFSSRRERSTWSWSSQYRGNNLPK